MAGRVSASYLGAVMSLKAGTIARVLVVDDEPDILELLELALLRMGLEVVRAGGVHQARQCLDADSFDLCLTDMRMPDGDGLDVVRYIAERRLDVPVAVITAHGNLENAVAVLKAGAFDYLSKPVANCWEIRPPWRTCASLSGAWRAARRRCTSVANPAAARNWLRA